jgi:uncharacterized protein YndB with AHSA1/START domain
VVTKTLVLERVIDAPRSDVWARLSTSDGAKTFFAPEAKIEAKDGGAFELLFEKDQPEGKQGSEGCKVVEVWAPLRLQHTWNFPANMPIRDETTVVTWSLDDLGKKTRLRLEQGGWQEGADWDAGYAYFEKAWDLVLTRLNQSFTDGPVDWSK